MYCRMRSMPIQRRLSFSAIAAVVKLPANGSATRSSSLDRYLMKNSGIAAGKRAGWSGNPAFRRAVE